MKTVKISELVEALNAIKDRHGDLVVGVAYYHSDYKDNYNVETGASDFLQIRKVQDVLEDLRDYELQKALIESGSDVCLSINGGN